MDDTANNENNDTLEDIVFNHFDNADELHYGPMDYIDMRLGMYSQPVVTEIMADHLRKSSSEINEPTASTSRNPIQLNNKFLTIQPVATTASDKLESIINETIWQPNQLEPLVNYQEFYSNDSANALSPVVPAFSNSQSTPAMSNEFTYQISNYAVSKLKKLDICTYAPV